MLDLQIKKAFENIGTQEKAGGPLFINPWGEGFTNKLGDTNACDKESRKRLASVRKQLL